MREMSMRLGWVIVFVLPICACGSSGSTSGQSGTGGGGSGNVSGHGTGASSSGGSGTGAASAGGSRASSGAGGTGGDGGAPLGGSGGVDAGPVIPGGPCVEPIATPASPACAMGQPKQSYCRASNPSELVMATCSSYGETQCDAASACAKGWHFCTGSEYLARGGRVVPKAFEIIYAWIAACVRDTNTNQLTDGPCSVCGMDVGMPPGMIYDCNGGSISPGMIDDTIGAMADTECHRIGDNIAANAGYWAINFSGQLAANSLCCVDGA